MSELKMAVCMKVVPKPEEIRVDRATMALERAGVRSEMNPPDMNALELALRVKDQHGGQVNLLSMGPPFFDPYLRMMLAMGADHIYLLSDRALGGADTLATTYTLAQGIRKIGGVDLIFCGEESSDGATGQVPPGLAEWLEMPQLTLVDQLDYDPDRGVVRGRRELHGGHQIAEVPVPAVISVKTAANEPRFMDYNIKPWAFEEQQLTIWSAEDLEADAGLIGWDGSPTIVSGLDEAPTRERKRIFLKGTDQEVIGRLVEILDEGL